MCAKVRDGKRSKRKNQLDFPARHSVSSHPCRTLPLVVQALIKLISLLPGESINNAPGTETLEISNDFGYLITNVQRLPVHSKACRGYLKYGQAKFSREWFEYGNEQRRDG